MPSRMVINTESIVGYNNMLVITDASMKLGVNNNVNRESHKASLKLMAGGPSKVNPQNSHPANPIHRQAVQTQGLAPAKAPQAPTPTPPPQATTDTPAVVPPQATTETPAVAPSVEAHHVNKALVAVGALALAGFVAWMREAHDLARLVTLSTRKATTARMSSQACLARKERACPAALKMELTIEPMRPGRREPSFWPTALSPCPKAFVPALIPFIPARARAPRTPPPALGATLYRISSLLVSASGNSSLTSRHAISSRMFRTRWP